MSISHEFTFRWSNGSGAPLNKSTTVTNEGEHNISRSVPTATTDLLVALVLDVSQLKGIYWYSDNTVLIETNSSSAAAQSITLTAGIPFVWVFGSGITNPLTTDITAIYITNASGSTALVEMRHLIDSTV